VDAINSSARASFVARDDAVGQRGGGIVTIYSAAPAFGRISTNGAVGQCRVGGAAVHSATIVSR